MDGFDTGIIAGKWLLNEGALSASTRFGVGQCLSLGSSTNLIKRIVPSSKVIVGYAWNPSGTYSNLGVINLFGDSGTVAHLTLKMPVAGSLSLMRGNDIGTQIATASIATSGWQYLEMSATISDTVGEVIVRVNGQVIINYTGDTRNGGTNTTIDTFSIVGANGTKYYDDLYICDGTGTTNNTFLGDVRVQTLMPNSAGSSTQFTPTGGANYANVAEVTDSTATYNASSTVGNRDTYAMADLSASTGPIYGVQNSIVAWKSDAGTGTIKTALKAGASVYYDSTIPLGTSSSLYLSPVREVNPATSTAWTVSDVNGAELGAEVA